MRGEERASPQPPRTMRQIDHKKTRRIDDEALASEWLIPMKRNSKADNKVVTERQQVSFLLALITLSP